MFFSVSFFIYFLSLKPIASSILTSFALGMSYCSVSSLFKEPLFNPEVSMEYELCKARTKISMNVRGWNGYRKEEVWVYNIILEFKCFSVVPSHLNKLQTVNKPSLELNEPCICVSVNTLKTLKAKAKETASCHHT